MIHSLRSFLLGGFGILLSSVASAQQVVGTEPVPNSKAAPLNTPITVITSEVLPTTAKLHVFSTQAGGKKAGTNQVIGTTDLFTPTMGFRPGERVLVTGTGLSASGLHHVFEFTTAARGGTGNFSGSTEVGIGPLARSLASADVDGDGDPDILSANYEARTVSVRLNDGHGQFSGSTEVSVGNAPFSVACADVDGDGDLDILTSNDFDDTISVRLNDGYGVFSGSTEIKVGRSPAMMTIGDVDGDGDLDVLTANYNANAVGVQLNDGHGQFSVSTTVDVGAGPESIVSADVDGDGDLDFLVGNSLDNTVSVRLNNGHGQFSGSTEVNLSAGSVRGVTCADVDGDGDLDFLTANSNGNTVSVRLNDGYGVFSGSTEIFVGQRPVGVTCADVDGDGDLDILTANENENMVGVLLNDGQGVFSSYTKVAVGRYIYGVVSVDVDGDGDLDILTANSFDRTVSVRLNQNSLPLPVHLTNFTAQSQGDLVQLAWQTQSQTNFAGFQLERSLDAREFIPLNWIPTQPPSAEPLAYGYNDLDLPATASLLYYRLKLVDLDGSSTYSSIRSVHLQDGQLGLLVRGNPVRGPLKLLLSSPLAQSLQLRLISSSGQLVRQQTFNVGAGRSEWELELGSMGAGVYELVLSDGTQKQHERLVIE